MTVFIEDEQSHRGLAYLDAVNEIVSSKGEDQTFSNTGLVVGFSLLSAAFALMSLLIIRCNWFCREFYEWNAIRLAMPGLCVFLSIQNATIAYDSRGTEIYSLWSIIVYMISSTIAPGIFFFSFVMTFLAYRTRSMPFCFVHRGPGRSATGESRQDEEDEVYQPLVRPAILVVSMRIFAVGLLVLNLLINFNVLSDDSVVGGTGWATVVNNPEGSSTLVIFLALLPMALVSFLCLYFACLLWRYGYEFSMIINTSVFNAWMFPVIGALAMIVGQMFGPDLFLITSNSGILLYMISMVRVLYLIRHDIREAGNLGLFLHALEDARSEKNREDNSSPSTRIATNGIGGSTNSTDALQSKDATQSSTSFVEESRRTPSSNEDEELGTGTVPLAGATAQSSESEAQNKGEIKIKKHQQVVELRPISTTHYYQ